MQTVVPTLPCEDGFAAVEWPCRAFVFRERKASRRVDVSEIDGQPPGRLDRAEDPGGHRSMFLRPR